jgi:hypothetical protein
MSQYLSEFCKENEINTVVDLGSGQVIINIIDYNLYLTN